MNNLDRANYKKDSPWNLESYKILKWNKIDIIINTVIFHSLWKYREFPHIHIGCIPKLYSKLVRFIEAYIIPEV